jgi:hypothetical protein
MSFREKINWISLLAMAGVYGWYFWTVMPLLAAGHGNALRVAYLLGSTVAILQIVPIIVVAIGAPRDAQAPEDEREKLFSLKGTRSAYFVLVAGALFTSTAGIFFGASAGMLANYILLSVVASNIIKYATQIAYFRMTG